MGAWDRRRMSENDEEALNNVWTSVNNVSVSVRHLGEIYHNNGRYELVLISFVTLGKSLHLSGPWSPHL